MKPTKIRSICRFQFLLLLFCLVTDAIVQAGSDDEFHLEPKMFSPEQMEFMAKSIKMVVLDTTKSCKELNEHLMKSPESLNWIGNTGAETMLKLAIAMDKIFNPNIMSLLFRLE